MNGKYYIGDKAATFKSTGRTRGIDGVALVVDDGTEYKAGDQLGYVLVLECPYGTQAMADALLEKLRGKSYEGFETTGAALPTGAELGDGVTVKGLYAPIVRRRVQFVGDLAADVSAPTGGDTDHEFGFTDPTQRQIERAAARSRSYIDKKADEIKLGVEDEVDGKLAEITVDLEGVSASVRSLSGDVGEVRGDLSLKVGRNENDQIVSMLNASANEINIKGNRFVLDSDNFKVAADGTATMTGANMTNAKIESAGIDSSVSIANGRVTASGDGKTGFLDCYGVHFSDGSPQSTSYTDYSMDGLVFCDGDNITVVTPGGITENGRLLEQKYLQKPNVYEATGQILNTVDGAGIQGYGHATVIVYPSALAEVHFSLRITRAGTRRDYFNWGVNRDLLRDRNSSIPAISPMYGGRILVYKPDGALDFSASGFGGFAEPKNQYWLPARVAGADGSSGGWSENDFSYDTFITGTVYGTVNA